MPRLILVACECGRGAAQWVLRAAVSGNGARRSHISDFPTLNPESSLWGSSRVELSRGQCPKGTRGPRETQIPSDVFETPGLWPQPHPSALVPRSLTRFGLLSALGDLLLPAHCLSKCSSPCLEFCISLIPPLMIQHTFYFFSPSIYLISAGPSPSS